MSDWLECVKKERDDLAKKTEKLHSFLAEVECDDEKRKCFDGWQLHLMKMQFDHMLAYLQILNLRIEDVECGILPKAKPPMPVDGGGAFGR